MGTIYWYYTRLSDVGIVVINKRYWECKDERHQDALFWSWLWISWDPIMVGKDNSTTHLRSFSIVLSVRHCWGSCISAALSMALGCRVSEARWASGGPRIAFILLNDAIQLFHGPSEVILVLAYSSKQSLQTSLRRQYQVRPRCFASPWL